MGGPHTFSELADRVARDTGWTALTFSFRGAGRSPGEFSPLGWVEDLAAAIAFLRDEVSAVWLAGFGFGGVAALECGARDPAIGGVAVFAVPSDFAPWVRDPAVLAAGARDAGVTPAATDGWPDELRSIDPLKAVAAIRPRPMLIVHGSGDDEVALVDSRALADAAEGDAELRVVAMAGHQLRHDPRVVAMLLGWLERQSG
jgi:putative redox protein